MAKPDKPNVHYKFTNAADVDMYGIGLWDEFANQYQCPLTAEERKITGCYAEFGNQPIGTLTLDGAHAAAKKLFKYSKEE